MNDVANVLIAEPFQIVAEDIADEIRAVCEAAIIRFIRPADPTGPNRADLLIWGWDLKSAELLTKFREAAAATRHVVVTASVERMDWDFPVNYLPFPARPEMLRQIIRMALEKA